MGEKQRDFHEGFLKTSPFPLGYHGLGSLGTENPVSFFNHSRTQHVKIATVRVNLSLLSECVHLNDLQCCHYTATLKTSG